VILTLRHLRELLRQPWYVAITLVQPVIWLLVFGELYKRVVEIPGFADIWRSPVARSRRVDLLDGAAVAAAGRATVSRSPARAVKQERVGAYGAMFWFMWKRLSGS
jgi:hypothetical protein